MPYLHELPIGTRFQIPGHLGVNILTSKLGEGNYENPTYPFRYKDALGIELTSTTNIEVIPLPKKGEVTEEYLNINNYKVTRTCIGFVVGIQYNSEGHLMEWLLNNKGDLKKREESPKIFDTPELCEIYINRIRSRYTEYMYYRPYFYEEFKKQL